MNIAIIDDLDRDRQLTSGYLETYFSKHCPKLPLFIQNFESGESFLSIFTRNSFDFIFMDYYMGDMSGLKTARFIRDIDPSVILIFITVSRDYAIDCYKVKASGYLIKPFTYDDLVETLSLIDLKQIREQQCIQITSGYDQIQVLLKDIIFCDISGHYVQIHTQSSGILRTRMTFSELLQLLKPYPEFLLCFRGCLINMDQVDHLDDYTFFMMNGERIPLRKKGQNLILNTYSEFIFEKVRNSTP